MLDALALIPSCHARRQNAGTFFVEGRIIRGCEPGTPDVEVMLPGERVIYLECKTATGRLSPAQRAWHAMAARLGHTVVVVRTIPEAVAAVRAALLRADVRPGQLAVS